MIKGHKIGSGFIDIGDKKSYLDAYKKYVEKFGKDLVVVLGVVNNAHM